MINLERIYKWLGLVGAIFNNKAKIKLAKDLIKEEQEELFQALDNNNKNEIMDTVGDSIWVLMNSLYYSGITIEEFLNYYSLIGKSNYSKFCESLEIAELTVKAYSEGTHWDKLNEMIDAEYIKVDDIYIVKRVSDGKILKSINYKSVESLVK